MLYDNLIQLVQDESTQVLITTHSSRFVSRSINNLTRLIRIRRDNGISTARRISPETLEQILASAFDRDESICSFIKPGQPKNMHAAMAAFKMELWMQQHRAASFFANRVVLVEGPTECALYAYLISRNLMSSMQGVVFIDCMGKYNIHRFLSLFGHLGIDYAVLYDGDTCGANDHEVSISIDQTKNKFTKVIIRLDKDTTPKANYSSPS